MKKIAILMANNVIASQVTGIIDFFSYCNTYWQVSRHEPDASLFQVQCVSAQGGMIQTNSAISIPTISSAEVETPDAIYIAGGLVHDDQSLTDYYQTFEPLKPLVDQYHAMEKPIAACCGTTFILAKLGLLNNREATTVWWLAEKFKLSFPSADLRMDKLVVQDGNIFTAGATSSYLSLCLKLTEVLVGEQIATQMAKIMLIDPNRTSQIPYMSLQPLQQHSDTLVWDIQSWMQQNIDQPINLDEIAGKFALTKRTLIRRFKSAINDTPANYLQKLRVEEAKRLLESTNMSVERIVSQVGYEDVSSFRKLFVDLAQLTPKAYREKFSYHLSA